jgi:Na+/H+ antiporter NhaC
VILLASLAVILVMAWALSAITQELHAAEYLVVRFGSDLSPHLLPGLTFVLAALISFAIGSCFGTIGIVMPVVVPLTWGVLAQHGMVGSAELHPIYLAVIASVLAGSIWGDHSSPISDTTILSSMSASCDHLEHVRTQMPYALAVGAVALVVGILPVSFGIPVWIGLTASAALVAGLPYLVGRRVGAVAEGGKTK